MINKGQAAHFDFVNDFQIFNNFPTLPLLPRGAAQFSHAVGNNIILELRHGAPPNWD